MVRHRKLVFQGYRKSTYFKLFELMTGNEIWVVQNLDIKPINVIIQTAKYFISKNPSQGVSLNIRILYH